LANTRILNLLDIPHFGRGRDINNCIKKLMEVTHGGYLWLEEPVSIDVELISFITGLPSRGENPRSTSMTKMKEKALVEEMKNTYGTERGSHKSSSSASVTQQQGWPPNSWLANYSGSVARRKSLSGSSCGCNTVHGGHYAQLGPILTKPIP
jgi:hypothetical protein